ncbi:MAG: hypothetical protein QM796_03110 [Chthoniobacteraceae bacterium]
MRAMWLFMLLLLPISSRGENASPVRIMSPDKKFQLLVREMPNPRAPELNATSFTMCNPQGKVLAQFDYQELPIIAIKWHKSANAVMILEHISHQEIMEIITLEKGKWVMIDAEQFSGLPDAFSIINANSTDSAFDCYYIGHDRASASNPDSELSGYEIEINVFSGNARCKMSRSIKSEEMYFYLPDVGNVLYEMRKSAPNMLPHYHSPGDDDEPDWFGLNW